MKVIPQPTYDLPPELFKPNYSMPRKETFNAIQEDAKPNWDSDFASLSTSSGSSIRSASPTPTVQTITESLYMSLLTEKHGRVVNATNPTYAMAADGLEVQTETYRLGYEHQLCKFLLSYHFGSDLYIGPVGEVLAKDLDANPGGDKMIMDFGTGTADWAIDMAIRFPHVQVLGIDLSPIQPDPAGIPVNCRIEVDDLNLDISHYYNTSSLVHIRNLVAGIRDYPALISQATHCLIPGGLLHVFEIDFDLYHTAHVDSVVKYPKNPKNPDYSASAHWMACLRTAMQNKRVNCEVGHNLKQWISEHQMLDLVEHHDAFLPVFSLFPDTTRENKIHNELAKMASSDFAQYICNARPLLLDQFSVTFMDGLEQQVHAELRSPLKQLYDHFFTRFATDGNVDVFAFDQRGWGKTACDEMHKSPDGAYGLTNRKHQLNDLEFFLKREMARVGPHRPIFLFGHSMGGGLVLSFGSSTDGLPASTTISRVTGIIAAGPLVKQTQPTPAPLRWILALLSWFVPWMSFHTDVPYNHLTSDPKKNAEAQLDSMMKPFATIGCINDILAAGDHLAATGYQSWPSTLPLLIVQGSADQMCSPTASKAFFEAVPLSSDNKKYITYEGSYHENHNEPKFWMQEVDDIIQFMKDCIANAAKL
ncbi:hypothetical protein FRB97_001972 [Tulasnella sp. 331]|nr:hypothetical protein FRB97_001972 [Tulasnella sp. 331]